MLIDKICITVLIALYKTLVGSGYEIIEKLEFLPQLETALSPEELNFALIEISTSGYIKLKFNDKNEFCVAMTESGRQSAEQLEKLKLKELSAKAVVGKSASGKMIITTIDDSPIYDTPPQDNLEENADNVEGEGDKTENLPAVMERKPKLRKPAGRIATFFYGTFGGVFGSGVVVGIMYLLTHLGIIV